MHELRHKVTRYDSKWQQYQTIWDNSKAKYLFKFFALQTQGKINKGKQEVK